MSFVDALLSPRLLLAVGAFLACALLLEVAARYLLERLSEVPASHWLLAHSLLPAARALALVVFVLLAYPTLFGLAQAPSLGDLLATRGRLTNLVNLSFVFSLLVPLLPLIGQRPALVLPLQGIAAASLLFHWLQAAVPAQSVAYWPGWGLLAGLLLLAYAGHAAARVLTRSIAQGLRGRFAAEELEELLYGSLLTALQAPVILLYTLHLGRQLLPR